MRATIIILILLAVGALFIFAKNSGGPIIDLNEGVLIKQDGTISGSYSINQIIELGVPYECSFKKSDEFSLVTGFFRMAEGGLRGDFDVEVKASETNFGDTGGEERAFFATHFIVKDGIAYNWTSLQNVGFKSPAVEKITGRSSTEAQAQIVGLDEKQPYECKPWNAVLNVFDLPTGINFIDLQEE